MLKFYVNHHWYFSILGALILLVLSLIPSGPINPISWINILHIDKLAHIIAYSVWTFTLILSFSKQYYQLRLRFKKTLLAFTLALMYGILMEMLQATISVDRVGEWVDVVANGIGCIIGLVVFYKVSKTLNLKLHNHGQSQNQTSKY